MKTALRSLVKLNSRLGASLLAAGVFLSLTRRLSPRPSNLQPPPKMRSPFRRCLVLTRGRPPMAPSCFTERILVFGGHLMSYFTALKGGIYAKEFVC
jgi:hypothetical protein